MIGIDPGSIVPLSPATTGGVPDARSRFLAVASDWVEDHVGAERFSWDDHWRHAPHDLLYRAFTRDEVIQLWHGCIFLSKLDSHLEEHDPVVWKVRHSLYRYGGSIDYGRFVQCYNGLGRVAVDLPEFNVRVTHTRSINTAAWADHRDDHLIYLDGPFGLLLHYRGEHVMTIGLTLAADGILVAQAQLRSPRGNRFLYWLPTPYLDFAVDLVGRAFPDDDLCLVTGTSTVAAIRRAYGKNAPRLAPETAARVERFYDQTLRDYARTDQLVDGSGDDGRTFVRLARRPDRRAA